MRIFLLLLVGVGVLIGVRHLLGDTPPKSYPKAMVSFKDYQDLMAKVEGHRAQRLVDLDTFMRMSQMANTIILDARSDYHFKRLHVAGAKHLCFTEFTQENLAKVIPNQDTTILIYCNNNITGSPRHFENKWMDPSFFIGKSDPVRAPGQEKAILLALNIPTYLNLYGYGYRNIYELDELVDVNDLRLPLSGTTAGFKPKVILVSESEAKKRW